MSLELFHIHTWRCRHASSDTDRDYVLAAIEMGANRIVFTDHSPFPGDLLIGRMDMDQLPEYISSLRKLKEEMKEYIDIQIGLEVEYLPQFKQYYEYLSNIKEIDCLLLGQHIYEISSQKSNIGLKDKSMDYQYLGELIVEGIESGFFTSVAHPDRIFKNAETWNEKHTYVSKLIIESAKRKKMPLEVNIKTVAKCQYRQEFWDLVPNDMVINAKRGLDAHSVTEMKKMNDMNNLLMNEKSIPPLCRENRVSGKDEDINKKPPIRMVSQAKLKE